jgi:hypothetical protein
MRFVESRERTISLFMIAPEPFVSCIAFQSGSLWHPMRVGSSAAAEQPLFCMIAAWYWCR